jgi:V/A-type H+-transporting ATPase subunit I
MAERCIEAAVELLDLCSGLLANTVSFVRAGAFALSHAGLSLATYSLAAMLDPGLATAGAVGVVVLGNLVIVAFEGLVCAIQSLRLSYYEFFGKFYRGSGAPFRPFLLMGHAP